MVLTLAFGTANTPTVLTGVATPQQAAAISVSDLTAGVGAQNDPQKWQTVSPAGLAPLAFTGAAVYLKLTTSKFVVYGAVSCGTALSASGMA